MTRLPAERHKLEGIQFGRGIAAILVVFYHAGRMLPGYAGEMPFAHYFAFGNAGVDFFFVLSGFIIYYVHSNDINQPARLKRYLWRRVTRIYPIYWVVTALVIAIFVLKRDWAHLGAAHVINSLLLIHERQNPILDVAWTLSHEMLFYLVFALAIASRTLGIFVAFAWLLLVTLGVFVPQSDPTLRFIASPYHFEFAMGIAAAFAAKKWQIAAAPLIALLGLLLFMIVASLFNDIAVRDVALGRILYGSASALIVFGIAVWETSGRIRFPAWAAFLGAASYSIYLIHTLPIGWLGKVAARLFPAHNHPDLVYVAISLGAVAVGCALYRFVEKPLQNAIRTIRVE